METAQMSISGQKEKQIMVYTYDGILFSHKKGLKYCCWAYTLRKPEGKETRVRQF